MVEKFKPKNIAIAFIKFYRRSISPLSKPHCKFYPTCSGYAMEAFERFGFFKGFALSLWRFLRCNPFSKGGYDPVPDKGKSFFKK